MIPIDPKEQKRQEEEQKLHRAAVVPMVAAMLLVAAAAGYVFWDKMTREPPRPAMPETMSRLESHAYDEDFEPLDDPMRISETLSVSDLISQHSNDEPFDHEPANLEPFPNAVRVAGIERSGGNFVEQITIWRVKDVDVNEVHDHYHHYAKAEGFMPIGSSNKKNNQGPTNAVHDVYWAPHSATASTDVPAIRSFGRILTLRIDPASDGSLRIMVDLTQARQI